MTLKIGTDIDRYVFFGIGAAEPLLSTDYSHGAYAAGANFHGAWELSAVSSLTLQLFCAALDHRISKTAREQFTRYLA